MRTSRDNINKVFEQIRNEIRNNNSQAEIVSERIIFGQYSGKITANVVFAVNNIEGLEGTEATIIRTITEA